MKRLILAFGILVSCIHLLGQVNTENREGTISYVSSGSVYVKFKNTDNISVGDTLYLTSNGNLVPSLTVNNLSSTSCECSRLSTANFTVGGVIYARIKIPATRSEQADAENNIAIAPVADTAVLAVGLATAENGLKQRITGSIAAISYSASWCAPDCRLQSMPSFGESCPFRCAWS